MSFDRLGRRIASGSQDKTVRVWDAESGVELACLRGHVGEVTSVSFDRSGRRIVSGSADNTVRVWDAESGVELARLRGHDHGVTSVSFDQSGRRIVSGSVDGTVRVWDAESGACMEVIQRSADVAAIAEGDGAFRWRTITRGQETVIEPAGGGAPVAWLPAELEGIVTHPSGRIWAGKMGDYVCLIRLVGEPDSKPPE